MYQNIYTSSEINIDYDDSYTPFNTYLSKYGAQTALNRAIIDGIINIES